MGRSTFWLLVECELKRMILSPRFPTIFAISTVLIVLSVTLGVYQYNDALRRVETSERLMAQDIEASDNWYSFVNRVHRKPDPMLIFVAGVEYDVGRVAVVHRITDPNLSYSVYSDEPLFALFRFFDFSFVVQIVLSLMAILFAYDTITGEREQGTLRMVMSNPVARTTVVISKFVGAWIGLVVPITLAILVAILVVLLMGVPLTPPDWFRLSLLYVATVLYLTVFVALGLLVSALTRRSAVSFLVLLAAWAGLVLVVPRLSTVVAGQFVDTISVAEVEGRLARFSREKFKKMTSDQMERWQGIRAETEGLSSSEKQAYYEKNRAKWRDEDNEVRAAAFETIGEHGRSLKEERRNQTIEMVGLALLLSRTSPASAFQLASMSLAGTGLETKQRYLEALRGYRQVYGEFLDQKLGTGMVIMADEQKKPRLSELPRFETPVVTFRQALAPALPDFAILALYSLLAFAGAYVAFLRYDVR